MNEIYDKLLADLHAAEYLAIEAEVAWNTAEAGRIKALSAVVDYVNQQNQPKK